jgi:hypothetical protein
VESWAQSMNILVLSMLFLIVGCRLEEPEARDIRAHTLNYDGVWHAASAANGARLCQQCHGEALAGGSQGEPSCLTCHGEVWRERSADVSQAPADHTVVRGIYMHHPNLQTPAGTCAQASCHGSELKGGGLTEPPSCYLCHAKIWSE